MTPGSRSRSPVYRKEKNVERDLKNKQTTSRERFKSRSRSRSHDRRHRTEERRHSRERYDNYKSRNRDENRYREHNRHGGSSVEHSVRHHRRQHHEEDFMDARRIERERIGYYGVASIWEKSPVHSERYGMTYNNKKDGWNLVAIYIFDI